MLICISPAAGPAFKLVPAVLAGFAHLQLSVLWKWLIFNVLWQSVIFRCNILWYTWSSESDFCRAIRPFCYCRCASKWHTWKFCESVISWIKINCDNFPFPGVQPGVSQSILAHCTGPSPVPHFLDSAACRYIPPIWCGRRAYRGSHNASAGQDGTHFFYRHVIFMGKYNIFYIILQPVSLIRHNVSDLERA